MRPRVFDGIAAALSLAPAVFLLGRVAARRFAPEGDPTVMLSIERAQVEGVFTATLFGTALLATGTLALASRKGIDGGRMVGVCFALGVAATVASAAVLR